eukprot:516646-Pyramimonas_sp.AAC.1
MPIYLVFPIGCVGAGWLKVTASVFRKRRKGASAEQTITGTKKLSVEADPTTVAAPASGWGLTGWGRKAKNKQPKGAQELDRDLIYQVDGHLSK